VSYLLVNEAGSAIQIENDASRLPRFLTKDWRAFTLDVTGDVPLVGDEVTLGESKVTAKTTTYQVVVGSGVVGEGTVSEAVE